MAPSPPPSARPCSASTAESRDPSGGRDANGNFEEYFSTLGASGVHPGDGGTFNSPQNEGGGAVRLTHITPISPTNEEVYSSEQLLRNPQPPIANSVLQVLSPSRPGAAFPYVFAGGPPIFSMQENEKYRKLMLKKQKRKCKQEKNVLNVLNAEDVVGHIGNVEDIDSVLQSMGEKVERKAKVKKSKEKNERTKNEKRERARKSVEKDKEDIEEEDKSKEDDEKPFEENIIKDEIIDLETRLQENKVSIQNLPHDNNNLSCEPNKELLEFIENQIIEKEKELECPVCLEIACSPIFMCYEQHLICSVCRPKLSHCPECRVVLTGENRRHRYAEKAAEELEKLKTKLFSMILL